MNDSNEIVRIGTAAIILKEGKVLMHKRKGKHAPGVWSFPGGHLEFKESFEEGIRREIKEETGLNVGKITGPVAITNSIYHDEGKHYVVLFFNAEYSGGEAKIMEPEKCEGWQWFGKEDLPKEVILPMSDLLKSGYDVFGETK